MADSSRDSSHPDCWNTRYEREGPLLNGHAAVVRTVVHGAEAD